VRLHRRVCARVYYSTIADCELPDCSLLVRHAPSPLNVRSITLAATLSNSERLELDSDSSLGFLSNERRFNVAITRATSL